MGNVLRNIAIGLALNFAFRKFGEAAGGVADNIEWSIEKLRKQDLSVDLRQGKVVGLIKLKLRVRNKNSVSIFLRAYNATISQEGTLLGSVSTQDPNIELPAGEERVLSTEFVVMGEEFTDRLQEILAGRASLFSPIDINGIVRFNEGVQIRLAQQVEFFAIS
jgi:hypothetical protein